MTSSARAAQLPAGSSARWGLARDGAMVLMFTGVLAAFQTLVVATGASTLAQLLVGLATAAAALGAYAGAVRLLQHRRATEVALAGAGAGLRRGLALGVATMTTTIALAAALGGYHVVGTSAPLAALTAAVGAAGAMASVAVTEELVFRAVLFRAIERRCGTWVALALSAAAFAALHLINPHATLWGTVALAVEGGALLGAAYAATRTLWLPIGIHAGWNWAQSALYGATTSRSAGADPDSVLRAAVDGPALLTGGSFGLEAGLPAILVCLVPTALLLRLAARRGHIVPRRAAQRPSTAHPKRPALVPHP